MSWWKCSVCGYLHEGEAPPESCPLCGVSSDKFQKIKEKADEKTQEDSTSVELDTESPKEEEQAANKEVWKCSVCGYRHTEDTLPESCPVCGVPEEKFAKIEAAETEEAQESSAETEPDNEVASEDVEEENPENIQIWKCSVCGYRHEGVSPPESCPLCRVSSEKFALLDDDEENGSEGEPNKEEAAQGSTTVEWKCSVCGYVSKTADAPEKCPLCGVDKDKFIKGERLEATRSESVEKPLPKSLLVRLIQKNHAHPILVHFPNGVLPMAVVFMVLAAFGCGEAFAKASLYSMGFVLLSLPAVIFSGYIEWKHRYHSARTSLFKVKILCSVIMSVLLLVLTLWQAFSPQVLFADEALRNIYLGCGVAMIGFAGIAGHLGGKLVFSSRS